MFLGTESSKIVSDSIFGKFVSERKLCFYIFMISGLQVVAYF